MSNELDRIMDLDPLSLSDQDLEKIVAYERKMQGDFEAGVKPKKSGSEKGPIDLSALGLLKNSKPKPIEPTMEDKPSSGLRKL